jgi:hypothetical protein
MIYYLPCLCALLCVIVCLESQTCRAKLHTTLWAVFFHSLEASDLILGIGMYMHTK